MFEEGLSKQSNRWYLRLLPPLLILVLMWFARDFLRGWAKEDWQRTLVWGGFFLSILEIVLATLVPVKRFVSRKMREYRSRPTLRMAREALNLRKADSADFPILTLSEDRLNYSKYAYILARLIVHGSTPMTIGIHGEWGSGKTSLANLIKHFLRPRDDEFWGSKQHLQGVRRELAETGQNLDNALPNASLRGLEIIELNAWQYADANSLWRALILQLSQRLDEKGLSNGTKEWQYRLYYSVSQDVKGEIHLSSISLFSAALQAFLAYVGHLFFPSTWILLIMKAIGVPEGQSFSLNSFDELFEQKKFTLMRNQMESIEEFQFAMRHLLGQLVEGSSKENSEANKVVFFIDDLDRCLPTVALEIMETIKTFLDVPGCVYVLLCDQNLLGRGVKAKFVELYGEELDMFQKHGREYMEKIIQLSFLIPPSDRNLLKEYTEDTLPSQYTGREIPYFDIVYAAAGDNPRKLKRLSLGLEVAFDMMQLSLGRSSTEIEQDGKPGTIQSDLIEPINSHRSVVSPTRTNKSMTARRMEFAKCYCLQHSWPEAIPFLRSYQASRRATFPPSPSETLPDTLMDKGQVNMEQASKALEEHLNSQDRIIFHPLALIVDWEKAAVIGRSAVRVKDAALLRFLGTPPYFSDMTRSDLKDYIEWSGVIIGDEGYLEDERLRERYSTPIEQLDLSVHVYNSLVRTGITEVGQLLDMLDKGEETMLAIRNFGDKSLAELKEQLQSKGYLEENLLDQATQNESLQQLSPRQKTILRLASDGLTFREIASEISYSVATVQNEMTAIYRTLGVNSRDEAVRIAQFAEF